MIYIYIYIERERDIYIYIYTYIVRIIVIIIISLNIIYLNNGSIDKDVITEAAAGRSSTSGANKPRAINHTKSDLN